MSEYTPSTDEAREVWCDWNTARESVPSEEAWAEHAAAFNRMLDAVRAEERERIARNIEKAGREDVGWLAARQDDRIDSARVVGAEDAWKSAVRIAREAGRA